MRKTVVIAITFDVLLGCSGCGHADAPPRHVSAVTRQDLTYLDQAQSILIGRCMQAHGFAYWRARARRRLVDDRTFPYGIDDLDWARQHGLGIADQEATARSSQQANRLNSHYVSSLSAARKAAYTAALFGSDQKSLAVTAPNGTTVRMNRDGCVSAARRTLYGDLPRWFRAQVITDNLPFAIQQKVYATSRYKQALLTWSTCMQKTGFNYRSLDDLRIRLGHGSRQREIRAAMAAARCTVSTRLAATGRSIDQRVGAPIRRKYASDLRTYRQMQISAVRRARALLSKNELR